MTILSQNSSNKKPMELHVSCWGTSGALLDKAVESVAASQSAAEYEPSLASVMLHPGKYISYDI